MAKKTNIVKFGLLCEVCNKQNYVSQRNKMNTSKLTLKKHCKQCKKHTSHKTREKLK